MEASRRYCNNFFRCKPCLFLEDVDFSACVMRDTIKESYMGPTFCRGRSPFSPFLLPRGYKKRGCNRCNLLIFRAVDEA